MVKSLCSTKSSQTALSWGRGQALWRLPWFIFLNLFIFISLAHKMLDPVCNTQMHDFSMNGRQFVCQLKDTRVLACPCTKHVRQWRSPLCTTWRRVTRKMWRPQNLLFNYWILIPCISKFILSELDRWVSEPIGFRKSKSRNGTSKRSLKPKSINIGDTLSIGGKRSKSTMASWIYLLMFFPNSVSLGSSAIVKVPEQVGAAKSAGNRVPRKVPRKSFLLQENPSEQPDRHGARLGTRFPGRGSQARFLSKVPRNRFPSKVSKRFPGTGSQARVPSKRFPSKVPRNRFPSKVPRNRFPSKVPRKRFPARFPSKVPRQANQEQIPKQGFPGRGYQEECCQEEVPRQGSQAVPSKVPRNRFPSKGSQARAPSKRFPCKGSQEKVPKQGSQEEVPKPGFPGRVFQEQVPKQHFQVQVFPSKTRFPEQVFKQVFPGRGFQEEVSKQGSQQAGSQAMFPGRGSQARFPATGSQPEIPRNRCPYKVPKNRFTSKVPRMFPGKGSQAKFPATESQARLLGRGSQARFPGRGSQARVPSCSWIFLLGNQLFLGTLAWEPVPASLVPAWNLAWKRFLGPCLGTVFGNRTCKRFLRT